MRPLLLLITILSRIRCSKSTSGSINNYNLQGIQLLQYAVSSSRCLFGSYSYCQQSNYYCQYQYSIYTSNSITISITMTRIAESSSTSLRLRLERVFVFVLLVQLQLFLASSRYGYSSRSGSGSRALTNIYYY